MVEGAAKSPRKEAIRLSKLLEISLGSDRFPVDVAALAKEVSRNYEDPIDKIVGDELPGFEGMLRPHKKRPAWHIVKLTDALKAWEREFVACDEPKKRARIADSEPDNRKGHFTNRLPFFRYRRETMRQGTR